MYLLYVHLLLFEIHFPNWSRLKLNTSQVKIVLEYLALLHIRSLSLWKKRGKTGPTMQLFAGFTDNKLLECDLRQFGIEDSFN